MGAMDKKTVFQVLDFYKHQGGNFIDAANTYQNEQSENSGSATGWLLSPASATEWSWQPNTASATKSTKASTASYTPTQRAMAPKSLHLSLDASLKKLQTHYIDIMIVHWWDFTTSISELMRSLNTVCEQATPQPGSSQRQTSTHAATDYYEGRWSAADRDFEHDIPSMCAAEGMILGSPRRRVSARPKNSTSLPRVRAGMAPPREKAVKVSGVLGKIAEEEETRLTSVTWAYLIHKAPYVLPIVGRRKVDYLMGSIEALSLALSPEEMEEVEVAVEFDPGFPLNVISPMAKSGGGGQGPKDVVFTDMSGKFNYVDGPFVTYSTASTNSERSGIAAFDRANGIGR
ncbi:MAG: hypothetical protein Q9188_005266 [Gyalolechia gomerana]